MPIREGVLFYFKVMKNTVFKKFSGLLLLVIVCFSCASDLDFNQVNDVKLEPVFVSNLASFEIPAKDFVTGGVEQNVIYAVPTVDIFNDSFFRNNLVKAGLDFEINNTINRAYTLEITFLDVNDSPIHSINFSIPAYTGTENLVSTTETFENTQLNILKRTTKMAFLLRMASGPALTENSLGSIKLRSGVTAYFIIE